MAAIVISDSESDSEFEQDVQEVTRRSLMTVSLSPIWEVVSDSDDDEEKVEKVEDCSHFRTVLWKLEIHSFPGRV